MKHIILILFTAFLFGNCEDTSKIVSENIVETTKKRTFKDIIGDTLYYEVGDAIFDIVISSDTTLYWKSHNPKYGKEAYEKITVLPINESENMVSYVEKGDIGVCWYNDFHNEIATVSVFVGPNLMTFSGTVKKKHK